VQQAANPGSESAILLPPVQFQAPPVALKASLMLRHTTLLRSTWSMRRMFRLVRRYVWPKRNARVICSTRNLEIARILRIRSSRESSLLQVARISFSGRGLALRPNRLWGKNAGAVFVGFSSMRDSSCALRSRTLCKVMSPRQRLVIAPTVPPSAFLGGPCTVASWHQGPFQHCYPSSYLSPLVLQITTLDIFLEILSVRDHRVRA
jgi:hypothetical protein